MGWGMAPEHVERMGIPFTRFTDVEDSMGLGLAYSKAIMSRAAARCPLRRLGLSRAPV